MPFGLLPQGSAVDVIGRQSHLFAISCTMSLTATVNTNMLTRLQATEFCNMAKPLAAEASGHMDVVCHPTQPAPTNANLTSGKTSTTHIISGFPDGPSWCVNLMSVSRHQARVWCPCSPRLRLRSKRSARIILGDRPRGTIHMLPRVGVFSI